MAMMKKRLHAIVGRSREGFLLFTSKCGEFPSGLESIGTIYLTWPRRDFDFPFLFIITYFAETRPWRCILWPPNLL
jgi:hypothetical protein